MKSAKQLERYFKGVANHRRIQIISVVNESPEITVEGIAHNLDSNIKTISEHTRRLVQAGLINKKYRGRNVTHKLSPYGKRFLDFMNGF